MFKRQKGILALILIVCICSLCFCVAPNKRADRASASITEAPLIIIDAGHGGFDGGAVAADGTNEKNINLKIATKLCQFLNNCGFRTIMTRTVDTSTETPGDKTSTKKQSDLKNRLKLMQENPDSVFVSIHLNKFTTSSARGSQIFYSTNDDNSKFLADSIQSVIVSTLQPENKRVNKQATSSTFLLYNATVPAVLVECGFLSNRDELAKLKDESYQTKLAFSIFYGIMDYFKNKEI